MSSLEELAQEIEKHKALKKHTSDLLDLVLKDVKNLQKANAVLARACDSLRKLAESSAEEAAGKRKSEEKKAEKKKKKPAKSDEDEEKKKKKKRKTAPTPEKKAKSDESWIFRPEGF